MPGCRVDYVNASGPLYGTREIAALTDRLIETKPDLALVMLGDVAHDSAGIAKRNGIAPDAPRADGLGRHWSIWNRAERFFGLLFLNSIGLLSDVQTKEADKAWVAGFESRLRDIVTRLKSEAPLVVLIQSGVPRTEARRPTGFAALHLPWRTVKRLNALQAEAMGKVARETGALLVDADAAIPFDRTHFDNALHLREPGREKMVSLLGDDIGPVAASMLKIQGLPCEEPPLKPEIAERPARRHGAKQHQEDQHSVPDRNGDVGYARRKMTLQELVHQPSHPRKICR